MKIFLVVDGFCHKDYSKEYKSVEDAAKDFAPDTIFIEAPDYVFEGWGYNDAKKGDKRFLKPTAPEGFDYDETTGTFYRLKTGKEKREVAYAEDLRIKYDSEELSVNMAEQKALFYLFEDTESAKAIVAELKTLITAAKEAIRAEYPDAGEPYK